METQLELSTVLVWVLAVATTAFPIVYTSIAPGWRRRLRGWVLMINAISFALLFDLTLLFQQLWHPSVVVALIIQNALFVLMLAGVIAEGCLLVIIQVRAKRSGHPTSEETPE